VDPLRISYLADESDHLVRCLADVKCIAAVPLLIERLEKSGGSRGYIMALESLGDPRAIPAMMKLLKEFLKDKKTRDRASNTDRLGHMMTALGSFKVKAAVPLLVNHLAYTQAIQALEEIGDPSVTPALRALVEDRGSIRVDGAKVGWGDEDRWAAARLALCILEDKDPIPGLCAQLRDMSMNEYQRRDVLWRLYTRPDPRSVSALVEAIRSDPKGTVVNACIEVLAGLRYPESVDGLIECFDASFEGKGDWKRAYTPQMFRDNVAESLRRLTGKDFPADKQRWAEWWKANRASFK
jgi:HEAT repeat protein